MQNRQRKKESANEVAQKVRCVHSRIASNKNAEKRKALKKAWQEYAKQVYINTNCIVDANANTEKRDTIKNFLLAMNEKESK